MDFVKTNEKLVVLGGALGSTNLDADGVKALAAMPSLDELRARIVGMISTPATRIARVLSAPAGRLPASSAPTPRRTKPRKTRDC